MRIAERNPVIYKIIGSIRRVGKAVCGTLSHNILIEFHGIKHARE